MSKTMVVTVSDDRFGRKGGKYAETQAKIKHIFKNNPHFGISEVQTWTWDDIKNNQFYADNEMLLRHTDPSKNGRSYKPYVILEALKSLNDGDFLIYTDCSPEMWNMEADYRINLTEYDLNILKELCIRNTGILTAHVKWDNTTHVEKGLMGFHTHEFFTSERCMKRMGLMDYKYSLQHASGMIVLQKNNRSMEFATEWLEWNLIDECGSLGPAKDDSFWADWHEFELGKGTEHLWDEVYSIGKIGHRHDQSVSGLLINKMNNKLIETVDWYERPTGVHPYLFFNFCKPSYVYNFFDSNQPKGEFVFVRDVSTMEVIKKKRND
jgi:hypothetical protein